MNPFDYEFLESGSTLDIEDCVTQHYTYNDLKNMDKTFLNDPTNLPLLQSAFITKVRDNKFSVIKNKDTGEYIFPMVPVRGNKAHARKKHNRIQPIVDTFGNNEYSKSIKGTRDSQVRMCRAIMITFSFAREKTSVNKTRLGYPIKNWNSYDAWQSLKGSKSILNQFKVELSRAVGSTYASCTVKEGCKDMFPAPHMIVIFDKPVIAHKWKNQWLLGQSKDRGLIDKIQAIWERLAGSHCKINAIIDKQGFFYAFKYIQKSINPDVTYVNEMTESDLVCFNTHLNQSLHGLNDVLSKTFLSKLNYVKEQTLLDITRNKLKHQIKLRDKLINEINEKGGEYPLVLQAYPHPIRYYAVDKEIERLRDEILTLRTWFFVRRGFTSINSAMEHSLTCEE